ncbi:MAG: rhomboid family intramembrane serine protease [Balneolaceae bacterium]
MVYREESFFDGIKRGYRMLPPAIRVLLTLCVGVFVVQAVGGRSFNQFLVTWFAFDPSWEVAISQPWRWVSYMFLHGSGFHLLFNMLWLWWMGRPVEEQMGPRSFTVLYLGAGIGGGLVNVALAALFGNTPVIGASGAVYGVMVAFAVLYPRTPIMLFLLPPLEARYVVAGLIFFDFLFIGAGDPIARVVHLGGAGVGYLIIQAWVKGADLTRFTRPFDKIGSLFRSAGSSKGRTRKKGSSGGEVGKRTRNPRMQSVRDVEIMDEEKVRDLDEILDKISTSGYEGLTAEEKKRLFELSKRH